MSNGLFNILFINSVTAHSVPKTIYCKLTPPPPIIWQPLIPGLSVLNFGLNCKRFLEAIHSISVPVRDLGILVKRSCQSDTAFWDISFSMLLKSLKISIVDINRYSSERFPCGICKLLDIKKRLWYDVKWNVLITQKYPNWNSKYF